MGSDGGSQAAWGDVHRDFALIFCGCRELSGAHADTVSVSGWPLFTAGSVQPAVHSAWHHNGLPGGYAVFRRFGELPGASDDRRQGHGVSTVECIWVLDVSVWRNAPLLQLYRRRGISRSWHRAGCWLVCLLAANRAGLFSRNQHGLLDSQYLPERYWHNSKRHQCHRHDCLHALQRNDAQLVCRYSCG